MKGESSLRCDEALELMGPFVDGELNPERARVLQVHLDRCPGCLCELKETEILKRLIASHLAEEARLADPGDLALRVESMIDALPRWRPFWTRPVWVSAFAALLLAVGWVATQAPIGEWFPGKQNDAVVEEIEASGNVLALWKEPETRTTVIWVFDNQKGADQEPAQ
jgi:anti-sigma factor RsiW